jgi:hypothetical protein
MPTREFACPQCNAPMRTGPTVEPGMSVRCPSCGSTVRVPGDEFTGSPPAAPPRPAGEFTDAPRYREDERDDFDRPDGPREGPGLEGLSNEYSINIGEWFRYAQAHWGAVLGPMIGYMLLFAVMYLAMSIIPCVGGFVVLFLAPPLAAGLTLVPLAQLKGQPWTFGDFFGGFRWYGALLGSYLLFALLCLVFLLPGMIPMFISIQNQQANQAINQPPDIIGAPGQPLDRPFPAANPPPQPRFDDPLFLIGLSLMLVGYIPAIFFSVRLWTFAWPLILDRDCGPVEALGGSWRLSKGHFWGLFGVGLLLGLINMVGVLPCYIGLLFTYPLTQLVWLAGYLLIAGTRRPVEAPRAERGY